MKLTIKAKEKYLFSEPRRSTAPDSVKLEKEWFQRDFVIPLGTTLAKDFEANMRFVQGLLLDHPEKRNAGNTSK